MSHCGEVRLGVCRIDWYTLSGVQVNVWEQPQASRLRAAIRAELGDSDFESVRVICTDPGGIDVLVNSPNSDIGLKVKKVMESFFSPEAQTP